jgi:3-hydroxyacyl-CoA dehydrogenase
MSSHFDKLLDWYRRKALDEAASHVPKPIRSIAIIGAGLMGVEIAAENLRHGLRVLLTDTNPDALAAAPGRIAAESAKYEERGYPLALGAGHEARVDPSENCPHPNPLPKGEGTSVDLLEVTSDEDRLAACDLILETVVEDATVKRWVYGQWEPRLAAGAILASNTSTIPIGELAAELKTPGRFCGIHFCHPVRINPLIEIIPGPRTAAETVATAVGYARSLRKMPIVVEDGPGFLVNRLLLRYTDEAVQLLMDGAGIEQIDRVTTSFGMAMGPFRILDEIGLDTSLAAGKVLLAAFPDRVAPLPILPLLVKRKQLGQKSGGGFYRYERTTPEGPFEKSLGVNPEALEIIEHYARRENRSSDYAILDRLLTAMILEATLILQEKRRLDPREIDLAMICGLGLPHENGGLLHFADQVGIDEVLKTAEELERLGKRFQPTPMLRELATSGERFYE